HQLAPVRLGSRFAGQYASAPRPGLSCACWGKQAQMTCWPTTRKIFADRVQSGPPPASWLIRARRMGRRDGTQENLMSTTKSKFLFLFRFPAAGAPVADALRLRQS